MQWKEKVQLTREALQTTPALAMVFSEGSSPDPVFIDELKRRYPYLDDDYVSFLLEANGMQLDMYQLFGSRKAGLTSIAEGIRRWSPIIHDDGVPIGEDPSGDCIVFARDGSIRLISYRADSVADGRILAGSFAEFIAEVLMGKLFPTLFPEGWTPAIENEWSAYLRRQSWL